MIVASAIPIVGPIGAEVIGLLIQPQITMRRDEWLESLGSAVAELMQQTGSPAINELVNNETFTTAVLHASQIALRTHQEEKLGALRNAVLNAALPGAPDDDIQHIFLTIIDSVTPVHMRFLAYFTMPNSDGEAFGFDPVLMLEAAFPDLKEGPSLIRLCVDDLPNRKLLTHEGGSPYAFLSPGAAALMPRISELGKQFLAFISRPTTTPTRTTALEHD